MHFSVFGWSVMIQLSLVGKMGFATMGKHITYFTGLLYTKSPLFCDYDAVICYYLPQLDGFSLAYHFCSLDVIFELFELLSSSLLYGLFISIYHF